MRAPRPASAAACACSRIPDVAGLRVVAYLARMRKVSRVVAGVALLLACGPDPAAEPAEFAERCGSVGPHRLLALNPGDIVGSAVLLGDRMVYVAGPGVDESALGLPDPAEPSIYSTDRCGDDRVLVAEGMTRYSGLARWPEALLGCRERDGDLYLLDPRGVAAPQAVLERGCSALAYNEHGLYRREPTDDAGVYRLVFYPPLAGPTPAFGEPIILLDSVDDGLHALDFGADEVLALDPAGDLWRVSLPDRTITREQTHVHRFEVSKDGRYLVWVDARTLTGDPDDPTGDIILRDRELHVDFVLAHADLAGAGFGSDRMYLRLGGGELDRVIWLPELISFEVPAGWHALGQVPDGRWLMSQDSPGVAPFVLHDFVTGEQTLVTDMVGAASYGDEAVYIVAGTTPGGWRGTGELWRFHYDSSEPELLARRAGTGYRRWLDSGRIATVIDSDAAGFGTLIAVDTDTLAESVIDERVFGRPIGVAPDDDAILYHVDDGDRSGVWVAELRN